MAAADALIDHSLSSLDDVRQALYRETQMALRAVVGARELDAFLADKDAGALETEQAARRGAGDRGPESVRAGTRGVGLTGGGKGRVQGASTRGRGWGTGTRGEAQRLAENLGCDFGGVAIGPIVEQFIGALAPSFADVAPDLTE